MGLFTKTKTADPSPSQGPVRTAGKIVLNFRGRSSKALQDMAVATLEAGGFDGDAAQHEPAEIGETMPDGTVYAGMSPDTGKAIYTTAADAPLTMTFNEAKEYASQLDAHGHTDWRVPSKAELNVLFNNRASIGGFELDGSSPAGWFWSSSSYSSWSAWVQRFSTGLRNVSTKDYHSSVRCVR